MVVNPNLLHERAMERTLATLYASSFISELQDYTISKEERNNRIVFLSEVF